MLFFLKFQLGMFFSQEDKELKIWVKAVKDIFFK